MIPTDFDCEQIETVDMDLADSDDPYHAKRGDLNRGRPPNLDPVDLLRFLCNFKSLPPEAVLQLRIVIEKYLPNVTNKELREKFTLFLQHLSSFQRPKLTEHGSGQAHSQFLMPSLPQATDNSGRSWLFPREYLAPLMDALGIKWKCLRDRPELELTEHPEISIIENDDDDDYGAQTLPMENVIENHTENWLWGDSCPDAREQFIPLKRRRLATDRHPQTRNESDDNEFSKRRRLETNGNYVNYQTGNESDETDFTDSTMETESLEEDENTNPWPNTQHTVGDGFHFQPCSVTTDTFGSHSYPSSYEPPNKRIKVSSW